MNIKEWDGLETRAELNSRAICAIEQIMGEIHTTINAKNNEIALMLRDLNRKKALLLTEPTRKINHLDCTIDLGKIESPVEFPLVELGPECKGCLCYTCSNLFTCTICSPNMLESCLKFCRGIVGIEHCEECEPWNAENIMKREG